MTQSGVVVGVLTPDGSVNIPQLKLIREESEGILLTFHRAIDVCHAYLDALELIIDCNCDRILTSGQQSSALRGLH
jgi:copper homeostasis protein